MSWQPICAIAHPRATFGCATLGVAVKPQVKSGKTSLYQGRWSG